MMQDIVDLRGNDWVPRREDNNPKTIDQIHKEAAEKAKKTQIMIQMAKQQEKKVRGGFGVNTGSVNLRWELQLVYIWDIRVVSVAAFQNVQEVPR